MENIRVMRYAELDMGDLTIICGDNNAGKTLVTQTIYGFLNFWNTQYQIPIEDEIVEELKNAGSYTIQLEDYVKQAPRLIQLACLEYTKNLRVQRNNENASFNFSVSPEEIKINDSAYESKTCITVTKNAHVNEVTFSVASNEFNMPDNIVKSMVSDAIKSIVFSSVCPRVYIINSERDMNFMKEQPANFTLQKSEFYITFSTVKDSFEEMLGSILSLLQLRLYLKHQARVGDLLIIEEPELSLHPKNQRKIARLLANLVNCGLKIMITTHSDYILREFNHLILLTGKSPHLKKIVKEEGYKDLELLPSSKKVRLYTAEEGRVLLPNYKRKTKVKTLVEIPIDNEGIPRSDFDDTINEMNRITDDIVFGG